MDKKNELDYADKEVSEFRQAFPNRSDEAYRIIRLMIIEAYRRGYEMAETSQRPYVPHPSQFSSEEYFLAALDAWRRWDREKSV